MDDIGRKPNGMFVDLQDKLLAETLIP